MRSFDLVDEKVGEADFFLDRLLTAGWDMFPVRCYFSAFVASARSITFALQAALKGLEGFDSWYEQRQQALQDNKTARFFNAVRRASQHIGINPVTQGVMRTCASEKVKWYFAPGPGMGMLSGKDRIVELARALLIRRGIPEVSTMTPPEVLKRCFGYSDLPEAPKVDVVTACQEYMGMLVGTVYHCYERFGLHIDAHQHYTQEHYTCMGKTIEDAEEELFGVRGWTAVPGVPTEYRWQMLRDSQPGCRISHLFEKYLGRTPPVPERLRSLPWPTAEGWYELPGQGRVFIPASLRKTGDPVKDIDLYVESLRKQRKGSDIASMLRQAILRDSGNGQP